MALQLATPKATKHQQPSAVVIPATPNDVAKASATAKQQPGPLQESRPEKQQKTGEQKNGSTSKNKHQAAEQQANKEPQQPSTLPMEPHAGILNDLQSKYNVRTLSVISSTRMEKRIKAVLEHLATPTPQSANTATTGGLPGIVLLHGRATDANKLISIVEVVKRRIRDGYFATNAGDGTSTSETAKSAKKKNKKKTSPKSVTAWYQYNRIYDVASVKKTELEMDLVEDSHMEEEDDGFAPMVHRFEDAINGKKGPAITTYLSIFLSRTPVVELLKNLEIESQSSVDPLEIEYQQWIATA
ncbi:hypothetical protein SBRCBS47491_001779 [Sporothrix bragantina]|uniref:DNA/RNA-binding protein Alba-like domain-containing protein n=1 Tax=Sporothrix bragantina TaxID=671064 RepID=A0ABP0B1D1_9PEZI